MNITNATNLIAIIWFWSVDFVFWRKSRHAEKPTDNDITRESEWNAEIFVKLPFQAIKESVAGILRLVRWSLFNNLPPAGVFWPAKKFPRWSQAQLKAAIRQRKYLLSLERLDIGFNSGESSMNSPAIIFQRFTNDIWVSWNIRRQHLLLRLQDLLSCYSGVTH